MRGAHLADEWLEMTVYFIKRVINGNRRMKKSGAWQLMPCF